MRVQKTPAIGCIFLIQQAVILERFFKKSDRVAVRIIDNPMSAERAPSVDIRHKVVDKEAVFGWSIRSREGCVINIVMRFEHAYVIRYDAVESA